MKGRCKFRGRVRRKGEPTTLQLATIADLRFTAGDVEEAKKICRKLLKSKRPMAQRWAASYMMSHSTDIERITTPQKHSIEHAFPAKINIELVRSETPK